MKFDIGTHTDSGPREGENQDSILAVIPEDTPNAVVLIVADGMGGAKAGEHASREAVAVIQNVLIDQGLPSVEEVPERLEEAILAANTSIYMKGQSSPEMEGMGCTVVVVLALKDVYWVASVGDSRAYLMRDAGMKQLTDDHTWVNARVREGMLTREQAAQHSLRHVLDRALGTRPTVEVDVWPDDVFEDGDMLVLCTDGMYGVIPDEEMAALIDGRSAQDAADALFERALNAPTHDNVSVVVLRAVGS
jgi:serine/threonine protein phosphatase PrpC